MNCSHQDRDILGLGPLLSFWIYWHCGWEDYAKFTTTGKPYYIKYIFASICVHIHIHIHIHIPIHIHIHIHIHVHVHIRVHIHIRIRICIHIHINMVRAPAGALYCLQSSMLWKKAKFFSMYHVDRGYADEQKRRIPRPKWLILFKFIVFFAMYLHMCSKLSSLAIFFSYLSSRCCHNFPRLVNTCPSLRRCHCLSNPNPNPMDQRAVEKRRCAVALLEALTP